MSRGGGGVSPRPSLPPIRSGLPEKRFGRFGVLRVFLDGRPADAGALLAEDGMIRCGWCWAADAWVVIPLLVAVYDWRRSG